MHRGIDAAVMHRGTAVMHRGTAVMHRDTADMHRGIGTHEGEAVWQG
jgi:hypothetical protein